MIEIVRSIRRLAPAVALLAALAACGDSTGPSADFDAIATADAMGSMVGAGEDLAPAFGSMAAAGDLFESETVGLLVAGGPALEPEAVRRYLAGPRPETFFPANFLGVTFEYSEVEGRYVPTELDGAPTDGIRILYYAVDPFSGAPQPELPLGHIDLRDLSTAASDRMGVEVVNTSGDAPITLAEYYVDVSWSLSQTQIGADMESVGYLSNGAEQLDFDLNQSVTLSETEVTLTQNLWMGLHGSDLAIRFVGELSGVPGSEETPALAMTVTVVNEGGRAIFDVEMTENSLSGTVTANGDVVAYIGGTPEAPSFTDAEGAEIDPAELEALGDVFEAASALFELAAGIFGPAQ